MIVEVFGQSLSPGNEQSDFWSSAAAATKGSRNVAGIRDPAVDALIDLVIQPPDRAGLVPRTRTLARGLLWGHDVIPHWDLQPFRDASWSTFNRRAVPAKYEVGFDTRWLHAKQAAALARRKGDMTK